MKKKALFAIILVALIALVVVSFQSQKQPAFAFSLSDLNGKAISQEDLKGKVTLINFWYPSCPGCIKEMPLLIETQKKFDNTDYQTFAISMNYNSLEEVENYVEQYGLPFTVMYDKDNAVSDLYGVKLAPNSFIVDKQGNVIKSYLGEPNWQELHKLIQSELEK